MLRLTGGLFGGRKLHSPPDTGAHAGKTRPTQAKLRQALFNTLQFEVGDARVLDLFAGAGTLGFEALSRGAASVHSRLALWLASRHLGRILGKLLHRALLQGDVSIEQGNAAARACAINLLAQLKAALGDLDKVVRVVRLGGFINSAPDFLDGPKVMNGASDLMVAVFGDKGRHARTTIGVAALPLDAAVEVEAAFEAA